MRSSYETYKSWYKIYSSRSEMDTGLLNKDAFEQVYQGNINAGVSNPARLVAKQQKMGTEKQAKNLLAAVKRNKEDIRILANRDVSKVKLKDIKANYGYYFNLVGYINPTDNYEEILSPDKEEIQLAHS